MLPLMIQKGPFFDTKKRPPQKPRPEPVEGWLFCSSCKKWQPPEEMATKKTCHYALDLQRSRRAKRG